MAEATRPRNEAAERLRLIIRTGDANEDRALIDAALAEARSNLIEQIRERIDLLYSEQLTFFTLHAILDDLSTPEQKR